MKPMFRIEKWSILAGLRFVLASIVAINHLVDFMPLGWLDFVRSFGAFEAILGFLLISGYSISCSYAKQPEGFLARRIWRIYPIYLAAILASYLVYIWMKQPLPSLGMLVLNLFLLNQLFTCTSLVGPAWSLSLEFWLYCLAPWLMRLSMKTLRRMVFVSFASFLVYTVLRTLAHQPYYSGVGYGANLVLLSFVWVAGLQLARSTGGDSTAMRDIGILFSGHVLLMTVIQFGYRLKHHALSSFFLHDSTTLAMQAATLAFVYLVFKHKVVPPGPALPRSFLLRWLGDISYPLYLLHAAVYSVLAHLRLRIPILFYLSAVLVSAGAYWMLDFYSRRRHLGQQPTHPSDHVQTGRQIFT